MGTACIGQHRAHVGGLHPEDKMSISDYLNDLTSSSVLRRTPTARNVIFINAFELKTVSSGFSESLEKKREELLKLSWAFVFWAQPHPHTSVRQGVYFSRVKTAVSKSLDCNLMTGTGGMPELSLMMRPRLASGPCGEPKVPSGIVSLTICLMTGRPKVLLSEKCWARV